MRKILVVAAHPDDEILGCGGTLLYYKKLGYKIKVIFLGDGETSRFETKDEKFDLLIKKRENQAVKVSKKSKFLNPIFKRLPDNRLDTVPFLDIVKHIEKEIIKFRPEIIFSHFENDLNIDHQICFKAVITATRPKSKSFVKKIICYETPSSTDFNFTNKKKNIFNPNLFIDISKYIKKKLNLIKIYKSEIRTWPHPRSIKSIKNLAMYRGSQIGSKYAEAFIIIRELNN